jgi:hypothetical protein
VAFCRCRYPILPIASANTMRSRRLTR